MNGAKARSSIVAKIKRSRHRKELLDIAGCLDAACRTWKLIAERRAGDVERFKVDGAPPALESVLREIWVRPLREAAAHAADLATYFGITAKMARQRAAILD